MGLNIEDLKANAWRMLHTVEDVLKANGVIRTSEGIQGQIWAWQEGQTLNLQVKVRKV